MFRIIHFEDISIHELIGAGSYGRVYKGQWKTETVAIKDVPMVVENEPFISEAKLLYRVQHPNIVQIYGTCSRNQCFYVLMEYADCGSLEQTLHGQEPTQIYSSAVSLSWARQCAEGITYLHAMKPTPMIHRDIKPANLLLFENKSRLKIINFGTVKDKSSVRTSTTRSAAYMAPEVFETAVYDEKCDVYSWAIVLWEILAREQPFSQYDNVYTIMWSVHNGQRPDTDLATITEPLKDLLKRCWHHDPKLRPSMEGVIEELKEISIDFLKDDEPMPDVYGL